MKKASKAIAFAMASAMAVSMAACGGSASSTASGAASGDSASATGNGSYDQITYAYATFNNIPTEEDLDVVEEEINKITREKIGAEITLKPISIADYVNKVSLSLQGGEKIDVYQSLGNFGNCVSTDMCYDISDLIDSCAPETKALLGDKFLDACKVNGKLYGIPTYKPFALTPMFIYRKDIADELGIDMSTVNSVEDVTPILEQVKEAKSDMIPLAPVQNGVSGLEMTMGDIDWLSDDYYKPVGVLMDGNMTVQDLYTTDTFKSRCDLARTWYNEGLIMKDAATTTSTAAECMSSGNYFGYIAAYSYPEADTAASLQAQCGGFELGAKMIGDAYLGTGDINAVSWMIASTTDVPEAALKFLNLTYTDKDIVNLLIYGIEGRDYIMNDDGTVSYPEGEDSTTVPYTAQLSCGKFIRAVHDGMTFHLGGRIETIVHMPGHSAGNCMVIDSKTGILFSGDAILSTPTLVIDGFPAVDHAELLTVEAFHTALVQHMKQLNKVKWLCPSHGRLMLSNKYVSAMQHCTEEILKAPDKWERYDYIPSLPGMIRCVDDAMIVYTLNRVHKVLEA